MENQWNSLQLVFALRKVFFFELKIKCLVKSNGLKPLGHVLVEDTVDVSFILERAISQEMPLFLFFCFYFILLLKFFRTCTCYHCSPKVKIFVLPLLKI